MVNEIATLLANHASSPTDKWYIDPRFSPITVPRDCVWMRNMLIGSDVDNNVLSIMSLLNSVDIEQYKDIFDSRELIFSQVPSDAYDLHYSKLQGNTLTVLARYPGNVSQFFTGDEYITSLLDLYTGTPEGTIKICAVVLALAYKMKKAYEDRHA